MTPGHFIPLAEETGMILPLGQWVLETACAQLVAWGQHPATADWTVAVNVSASQLAQAEFVQHVKHALHQSGAPAQRLKLEITESMLVNDMEDTIAKMSALKALGVSFSLDDFGTGYSSLSYLKELPIDVLKIDQSFVQALNINEQGYALCEAMVSIGKTLKIVVVAEGVETLRQLELLQKLVNTILLQQAKVKL